MANLKKASHRIISVLMTTIHLNISPATANDQQTKQENAAFKEAVQAVKDKNYTDAIALFEEQAKLPRHAAQYNLALLLNAGKGRPRDYVDALYWSWQAQLGNIAGRLIRNADGEIGIRDPNSKSVVYEGVPTEGEIAEVFGPDIAKKLINTIPLREF